MTRRTRRLLIALPLAVALSLAVAWLLWPRTAITRENAARIQEGMTLAEVEAILGGPAREEGGRYPVIMGRKETQWSTPDLLVCVTFGDDERVWAVQVFHDDGLLAMLRRWLRL
jgi:hypothetical protein